MYLPNAEDKECADAPRTGRPRQLLLFAAVGVLAFAVDASLLHLAVLGGLGPYLGRILSYLGAVTVSWEFNRRFTFARSATRATFDNWSRFAVSQLGGATLNLGCYFLLLRVSPTVQHFPVLGVAAGSLAGMLLNFVVAAVYVFRGVDARRDATSREPPIWLLLILVLMWPALYNGQGVFFFDTITYVRGADTGIGALLHVHSHWSEPEQSAAAPGSAPSPQAGSDGSVNDAIVLTGRSWFYGALVYAGDLLGRFWLTVLVQAAAAVAAIALTLRALRLPGRYLLPIAVVLALVSSLPFYVSFLMPDVFTSIAIAGSAVLLTRATQVSRAQLFGWWLLLSGAALFHDTNLLILGTLLAVALGTRCVSRRAAPASGMIAVLLALMIGVLGHVAFALGVRHYYGVPPVRPPFLTARLIEDGTGVRYLRATCPGNGFQVCNYLDRLPMPADDFLWQSRRGAGVFATARPADRRRMAADDLALARAVFAFDPVGQLFASLRDAAQQLMSSGLWEFEYTQEEKAHFDQKFPRALLPRLHASAAERGTMPIATYEWILLATFYLSVCLIAATLLWPGTRQRLRPGMVSVSLWILLGVVVNAFYCGVLSGPHERYSARVQWLLPFAALLLVAAWRTRRAAILRVGQPRESAQL